MDCHCGLRDSGSFTSYACCTLSSSLESPDQDVQGRNSCMVWKECLALVEMQSHSALVQLFARVLIQRGVNTPFLYF